MSFSRIITNVCADDLASSREVYVQLLGVTVNYDSDWYVQRRGRGPERLEFGIIRKAHELEPMSFQTPPSGMYVTFVVPDVDALHARAVPMGAHIVQAPRNEFYGQRRCLALDPAGCPLDLSAPFSERERTPPAVS